MKTPSVVWTVTLAALGFACLSGSPADATPAVPMGAAPDLTTAVALVAKKTIPAVVHIEVTQRQEVTQPASPFDDDPLFRFFQGPGADRSPRKFQRELRGLGSGMIIDGAGRILTNNHVVAGATSIDVVLATGSHHPAKVVGTDPKTDLAVIQIAPSADIPRVVFGDSDRLEVGEWVVAIGHPRGLDQTVTQGIVSAKHRRGVTDPNGYQDFIQTDAAINPGNSGGPLLNLRGEVIGVNAAIVSESGGFEGIGFAIPSNMAQHVVRQLIASGKVTRGWLGVSAQDLTQELAKGLGLATTRGALVADVAADSPASAGGLKRRDVIQKYQGQPIEDAAALRNEVAATAVGANVPVVVWRGGRSIDLALRVADLSESIRALSAVARNRLGVTVRPVSAAEAKRYGLEAEAGVAIASLVARGPLAQAGFEVNDLLLEIGEQAIQGVEGLAQLVSGLKRGDSVALLALDHRTGQSGYVQVTAD